MTVVRVKGFQIIKDKLGRPRYAYHRKTRIGVDLEGPFGSAEFFAECARIAAAAKAAEPNPGTLGKLMAEYRAHDAFTGLAPLTRRDYEKIFSYLAAIEDTPLKRFDRPLVTRIRDKAHATRGRRFGSYVKTCLSILLSWGLERGYVSINAAAGIKDMRRPRGSPRRTGPGPTRSGTPCLTRRRRTSARRSR